MANFTGSWARAAGLPMPDAVNPMGQPSENPAGTGAGPMTGSLRPKPNPQAGLGQAQPQAGLGRMVDNMMSGLFGGSAKGSGRKALQALLQKKAAPSRPAAAPAQAAGLSTPSRSERASKLFAIGAGLTD